MINIEEWMSKIKGKELNIDGELQIARFKVYSTFNIPFYEKEKINIINSFKLFVETFFNKYNDYIMDHIDDTENITIHDKINGKEIEMNMKNGKGIVYIKELGAYLNFNPTFLHK